MSECPARPRQPVPWLIRCCGGRLVRDKVSDGRLPEGDWTGSVSATSGTDEIRSVCSEPVSLKQCCMGSSMKARHVDAHSAGILALIQEIGAADAEHLARLRESAKGRGRRAHEDV